MLRRNRLKNKVIAIGLLVLAVVIYNEFSVYDIQKLKWSVRECSECVKVLLVADSQILGQKNENYFGSWIAQWDSDKYLKKTFSRALDHSNPHVVIFLGDLMDEGHIANAESFKDYKRRLDSIFEMPDHIMRIYLPGDNDIGGEEDVVSSNIYNRFNFAYSQPDTLVYKTVTFFKVNRLTHTMPEAPKDAFLNDYAERNTTNVVLSHMPLLFMPGTFVQNVLKELSPQIIFTAHEHKAMHISLDPVTDQLSDIWVLSPYETLVHSLRMDVGDIHELQIPTCSYRMGTPHTGYGLVYIDTQEKMINFTILWLPGRFPQLWIYVFVGIFILAFSVCTCISSYCVKGRAAYSRMSSI